MSKRRIAGLLFGFIVSTSLWLGAFPPPQALAQDANAPSASPPETVVTLKQTAVPSRVFSISDEVVAYRAEGKRGKTQEVPVSLKSLRNRVGGFDQAIVYAFDQKGKVLGTELMKVGKDGTLLILAPAGHRYVIYAHLGERYRNAYGLLCRLRAVRFPPGRRLIPRICTQILCGSDVYPESELAERVPEIESEARPLGLGGEPIGGFGGSGNICDQCLGENGGGEIFYPTDDCLVPLPQDPQETGPDEEVVYVHTPYPFDAPSGNSQIYKMNADGSNPTNLSNNNYYEYSPDVRHDGQKITFVSSRPGSDRLHIMDIDGSNVMAIANTAGASKSKWSRGPDHFIVFTYPANGLNEAIWRIKPDGSNKAQITNPGAEETDEMADVVDDKHIVFTRLDRDDNFNRDLYIKYIWDNRPPVRLTNTSDRSETMPVVSHDGSMLAYRVFLGSGHDDQVHVANFDTAGNLNVLQTIDLNLPATINISSIDFSGDDKRLYISTQANDVPGNLINRFQEVFRVKLDGSNQVRLTDNSDADVYPNSVPR